MCFLPHCRKPDNQTQLSSHFTLIAEKWRDVGSNPESTENKQRKCWTKYERIRTEPVFCISSQQSLRLCLLSLANMCHLYFPITDNINTAKSLSQLWLSSCQLDAVKDFFLLR